MNGFSKTISYSAEQAGSPLFYGVQISLREALRVATRMAKEAHEQSCVEFVSWLDKDTLQIVLRREDQEFDYSDYPVSEEGYPEANGDDWETHYLIIEGCSRRLADRLLYALSYFSTRY